jgi:hypothetical protein
MGFGGVDGDWVRVRVRSARSIVAVSGGRHGHGYGGVRRWARHRLYLDVSPRKTIDPLLIQ